MSNEFIFNPINQEQTVGPPEFYTLKGKEDYTDNDQNPRQREENIDTQAKLIYRADGQPRHYIKIAGDGKPYNPISEYANVKTSFLLRTIGKNKSQFKEVNNAVFTMYLNFLKTKNTVWLHNTEREMI